MTLKKYCICCGILITRLDDPLKGFCSERCIKNKDMIDSLDYSNLVHVCFWYYTQRFSEFKNTNWDLRDRRVHIMFHMMNAFEPEQLELIQKSKKVLQHNI